MKALFVFILFFSALFRVSAQTPPAEVMALAPDLELNTALSDEFDGTKLDTKKWKYYTPKDGYMTHYPSAFYAKNAGVKDGSLILSATDTLHTTGIYSVRENYNFGYYEMRAILPAYIHPDTQQPSSIGMWTAFWLVKSRYNPTDRFDVSPTMRGMFHDEVDIQEGGSQSDKRFSGIHIRTRPSDSPNAWENMLSAGIDKPSEVLSPGFHTFGFLYLPSGMYFYIDGRQFYSILENRVPNSEDRTNYFPTHPMKVIISHQLNSDIFTTRDANGRKQSPPNLPWPINFTIDYFRFYEYLDKSNDDTQVNSNWKMEAFLFDDPENGLRKSITIDGAKRHLSTDTDKNYLLRASDKVIIKGNFNAPPGTTLQIVPAPLK